jgi:hypothetical protein
LVEFFLKLIRWNVGSLIPILDDIRESIQARN